MGGSRDDGPHHNDRLHPAFRPAPLSLPPRLPPRLPVTASPVPPPDAAAPAFSLREFRTALGTFATGVTIVTARATDGTPVGLTANSFNSVSLDPPLVLWSLAHTASAMRTFATVQHYAIHVLAADQRALAERFAGRATERWIGQAFTEGRHGVPLIDGAAAVFECESRSRHPEGDHTIFVGRVAACRHRGGAAPLLFHGGRFYTEHPL